jgi:hypothetical protein
MYLITHYLSCSPSLIPSSLLSFYPSFFLGGGRFLTAFLLIWRSWDRASWYLSTVKPTRCIIFEFIEYHSTSFGQSFRPSSGVQDCTHSIKYMSYRLVDCLLAGTRRNDFLLMPASKQSTNLYDIYLMLCVQSWSPDDGRKDCPKHVKWYSISSKIVHLVGFIIEIIWLLRCL